MKNIISASRRTDIPAFFGEWFMERIRRGAVGCINPFGGQKYTISLRPEDVFCIVFWSKNFAPFIDALDALDDMGYKFYFQFTITGHPELLESNTPPWEAAVDTAHALACRFSPRHVIWRFDPVVLSSLTPRGQVVDIFSRLAAAMEGATHRCIMSYVSYYGKVQRSFERLAAEHGVTFYVDEVEAEKLAGRGAGAAFEHAATRAEKIDLACELRQIAGERGMALHACCNDWLVQAAAPRIRKAHCVDGALISELAQDPAPGKPHPTRPECGCWQSRDIGAYDTCAHGCAYCYANVNKPTAEKNCALVRQNTASFALCPESRETDFPARP